MPLIDRVKIVRQKPPTSVEYNPYEDNSILSVIVTMGDGTVKRIDSSAPVPVTPPVPPVIAPRPTPTEILATPGNWATALKAFRDGRQLLLQCGSVFPIRSSIQVPFDGVKIGSYGTGDPPVLFDADEPDGEQVRCAIGVGGSAEDVEITGLCFDSPDSRTSRFGAIWSSGKRVHIHDNIIRRVFDFVNITSTAAAVHLIDHNEMLVCGGVGQYFLYAKGKGHEVRRNKINNAQVAFVRCNLFEDLTIEGNDIIGVAGSDMMPSRITIGKGKGYVIRGNHVKDAIMGANPLDGQDGFRDEGYDAARMAAVRTSNGVIENNTFDGPGCRIIIKPRVDGVRIQNNIGAKLDIRKEDELLIGKKPGGTEVRITLPGAKGVVTA